MKVLRDTKFQKMVQEIQDILSKNDLNPDSLILMAPYMADPNLIEYVSMSDGSNPIVPLANRAIHEALKEFKQDLLFGKIHDN